MRPGQAVVLTLGIVVAMCAVALTVVIAALHRGDSDDPGTPPSQIVHVLRCSAKCVVMV